MSKESNMSIVNMQFEKKTTDEIMSLSHDIDSTKIAEEVYTWVINNVESYVDSTARMFKLDMIVDDVPSLSETKRLQDLYRAIPDDDISEDDLSDPEIEKITDECQLVRRHLDTITKKAYKTMGGMKEMEDEFFKRMIFYYEKLIPTQLNKDQALKIDEDIKELINKKDAAPEDEQDDIAKKIADKVGEGAKLLNFEEMEGCARIIQFDYESFSVDVKVKEGTDLEIAGEEDVKEGEKKIIKQYVIPEGFSCWVELSYKIKQRQTAMF